MLSRVVCAVRVVADSIPMDAAKGLLKLLEGKVQDLEEENARLRALVQKLQEGQEVGRKSIVHGGVKVIVKHMKRVT